ncbi:ArfGap-domain-containing protein [Wallemia mellicola]|nr:ArfGap-domain-containing protein [Wallemia mellicola]
MSSSNATERLKEVLKREENKKCVDCNAPQPQWASLNNCVFCCLECSGKHRGLGVHISFVRSTNMDAWKDEQIGRMELFGNGKFREVIEKSSTLSQSTPIEEKYTSEEVEKYREEINAIAAEKGLWLPAQSPATTRTNSDNSTQTRRRRKDEVAAATGGAAIAAGATAEVISNVDLPSTAKNEEYFEKLGRANETRSEELPPSQGGKYTGFGNAPAPKSALSSDNVPTVDELRENPMEAVTKGWGLFSSAIGGAASAFRSTVDDKLSDPNIERDLQGYKDNLSSYWNKATEYGNAANEWTKKELEKQFGNQASGSANKY